MYAFTSLAVNIIMSEIPDPGGDPVPDFVIVWKTTDVVLNVIVQRESRYMELEDKYWYIWG